MATSFIAKVKPSAGDYTTLSAAEAGLQNDLTAATILVFSISAASTPTIAAGDSVTGLTSAATGTCVLVNAARTQILIKTIAGGPFQSGETVKKTSDAAVTVTLSSAGDSPIVVMEIDGDWSGGADTTAVTIDGWTTDSTHYIEIRTATAARHDGKWNSQKYILSTTLNHCISVAESNVRIIGLQLWMAAGGSSYIAAKFENYSGVCAFVVDSCVIRGTTSHSDTYHEGLRVLSGGSGGSTLTVRNSVIYNFPNSSGGGYGMVYGDANFTSSIDNCTIYNCGYGYYRANGTVVCRNCAAQSTGTDGFTGTISGNNNCSDRSSDAPGTDPQTGTVTFVDAANGDLHLAAGDTVAKDNGADLSGTFTTDIDGVTRSGTWDIGADEYVSSGTTHQVGGTIGGATTIAVTALALLTAAATIASASTITGDGLALLGGSATIEATSTAAGNGLALLSAAETIGATSGVTGDGLALLAAFGAIGATSGVTPSAIVVQPVAETIDASSSIAVNGLVELDGGAGIGGGGTVVGSPLLTLAASGAISITSTVHVESLVPGGGEIGGNSGVSGEPTVIVQGDGLIAAQTSITGVPLVSIPNDFFVPDTYRLQYRRPFVLPRPPDACDAITNKRRDVGREFQVRLQLTGKCRLKRLNLVAHDEQEDVTAVCPESELCVAETCDICTDTDWNYAIVPAAVAQTYTAPLKRQYRTPFALPVPTEDSDASTNKLSTFGAEFQTRVTVTGKCRLKMLEMTAHDEQEDVTAVCPETEECRTVSCFPPNEWEYTVSPGIIHAYGGIDAVTDIDGAPVTVVLGGAIIESASTVTVAPTSEAVGSAAIAATTTITGAPTVVLAGGLVIHDVGGTIDILTTATGNALAYLVGGGEIGGNTTVVGDPTVTHSIPVYTPDNPPLAGSWLDSYYVSGVNWPTNPNDVIPQAQISFWQTLLTNELNYFYPGASVISYFWYQDTNIENDELSFVDKFASGNTTPYADPGENLVYYAGGTRLACFYTP